MYICIYNCVMHGYVCNWGVNEGQYGPCSVIFGIRGGVRERMLFLGVREKGEEKLGLQWVPFKKGLQIAP